MSYARVADFKTQVREVHWACDCIVGGGDRDALVHHVGCASQAAARAALEVDAQGRLVLLAQRAQGAR